MQKAEILLSCNKDGLPLRTLPCVDNSVVKMRGNDDDASPLRQNFVGDVGESHGVWSPGVDVHGALAADGLDKGLLRSGDITVAHFGEFELDVDGTWVVCGCAGRVGQLG
jgi:hypothetical protein